MTPQQANELLPCAHCAGEATLMNMNSSTSWQYWMAACECGIQYEGPTAEDCTEMWNRRAPEPTSEPGARDAAAAIRHRIELAYRLCCSLSPKQSVGEILDVALKMPEWAALATPASPAVPSARQQAALQELSDQAQELDMGYGTAAAPTDTAKITLLEWELSEAERTIQYWKAKCGADPAPLVVQASPEPTLPLCPSEDEVQKYLAAKASFDGRMKCTATRVILERTGHLAPEASPLVEDAQQIVAASDQYHYTFTKPEGWINLQNPGQSWEQWTKTQGLPTTGGWKVFGTKPVVAQRIVAGKVE